jgi:hypothetical protein
MPRTFSAEWGGGIHRLKDKSHCGYTSSMIADVHILRGALCITNIVPLASNSAYTTTEWATNSDVLHVTDKYILKNVLQCKESIGA